MFRCLSIVLTLLICTACSLVPASPTAVPTATDTPVPTATPKPTEVPTATPEPTPVPKTLWLGDDLPDSLSAQLKRMVQEADLVVAESADDADAVIGMADGQELALWVYQPVAPFPTLTDDITLKGINAFWQGDPGHVANLSRDGHAVELFLTANTLAMLTQLLGEPSAEAKITIVEPAELISRAWDAAGHGWAIVPFEELDPQWKVLRLDGMSLLDKEVANEDWPLQMSINLAGEADEAILQALEADPLPQTNRDVTKITTLVMTGVTAMVRSIAYRMEIKGILYPGEEVNRLLETADLTHISNEIPFYSGCPYPDPVQQDLVFCSDPRYIELLQDAGADLIELTGNHFQDYGDEATLETLAMYDELGWPYYGGGANLEEASRPMIIESNGNSFSFIGCNPVGPIYAWATEDRPGAAPCDYDYMTAELEKMSQEVDVPIATFQYHEIYEYWATEEQQTDFRRMVDAGAKIVSGSQSHHPQAFEFYKGGFIHYGLGNLFFDQMQMLGTRQEFVDWHVIYDGRHISTVLYTYMLEDYARPRLMTVAEREQLLTSVFEASGW